MRVVLFVTSLVAVAGCVVRDDHRSDPYPRLWPAPRRVPERADPAVDRVFEPRCAAESPEQGTAGSVDIRFTTEALGRTQYGPMNAGAAWIEAADGRYLRTLELWGSDQRASITLWDLRYCKDDSTVDAVSSATLPEPAEHSVRWDARDYLGQVVPDGEYVLWLQVTENEIVPEGPTVEIAFSKRTAAWRLEVEPDDGFRAIELRYTPAPPH